MKSVIPLFFILTLSGCQMPQWRVFEAKVPAPIVKQPVQIEAERAAADLVARTITAPPESIPVAQKLSESLGAPAHPITQAKPEKARNEALDGLRDGIQQQQRDRAELNEQLAKYDGKAIAGTGFNLFGVTSLAGIIGIIALCVLCPGAVGVLFFLLRRMRSALAATVEGIESFKESQPRDEVTTELETALSKKMDTAHKSLIKKIKSKI